MQLQFKILYEQFRYALTVKQLNKVKRTHTTISRLLLKYLPNGLGTRKPTRLRRYESIDFKMLKNNGALH